MSLPPIRPAKEPIRVDFRDFDVQRRVQSYLGSRSPSAFRRLEVEVENGRVTLSGLVDSFYDKQVAITTCRRVAGVLATIDRIAVETEEVNPRPLPSAGPCRS